MHEITSKSAKTANQAWRKKPRKFAPKSRLGCKTCKIRRVKCDLSWPSCLRCQSTGRTCDGYEGTLAFTTEKTGVESSNYDARKADSAESDGNYYYPCTAISSYQPKHRHAENHGLILQDLGPFMVLPVTGSAQAGAMCFFQHISIKHLNQYHPCEAWRSTLMFFSQTVPSVRHAAMALALIHQQHMSRVSSDRVQRSEPSQGWLPDEAPLLHYNRAIQLLPRWESGDSTQTTAVTLLVCYLFTCFDHLACNYAQACMKHLRGGVELLRNIKKTKHNDSSAHDEISGSRTLICQVARQIRRLDMQAVMFLVDWTPADIQDTSISHLPPYDSAFRSLEQAADHVQILVSRVMNLRNTEQRMSTMGQMPQSLSSLTEVVFGQLETWLSLFENMLQRDGSYETDYETNPLISLLRLHYIMAWTLLSSAGTGREMDYDDYLPQFQQCVALVDNVAAAHERYSGSPKAMFTPEVGIVPVLYMIGVKCRHPMLRRKVVSILRRQPIREAVWDSIIAARVVERVIEIEEDGSGEGAMTRSMPQISVWQRVETLSWVHIVSGQSAGSLDIEYMFCGRQGTLTESLTI